MVRVYIIVMALCVCGTFGCSEPEESLTPGANNTVALDMTADISGDVSADMLSDTGLDRDMTSRSDLYDLGVDQALDISGDASEEMSGMGCESLQSSFVTQMTDPAPPYAGTVWYAEDIITASDPSSYQGLTYEGTGTRTMFDRRTASFEQFEPHLYNAVFGAQTKFVVEIQVNPEFDEATARQHAERYARVIGQIPAFFYKDLKTVWIHAGKEPFGGGNNNLLIHTEQGDEYEKDGVLEEVFLHEGAHTSLDAYIANDPVWLAAQVADGQFISTYARDNPRREDVAETIGPFLAIAYRRGRISQSQLDTVSQTVPNRIKYLQCQPFDMSILP